MARAAQVLAGADDHAALAPGRRRSRPRRGRPGRPTRSSPRESVSSRPRSSSSDSMWTRSITVRSTRRGDLVLVLERLGRRRLGEHVDAERLAHDVAGLAELLGSDRVADAQPAEAVDLGERAQQDQVVVALEQVEARVRVLERRELDVGLVEDHRDVARQVGGPGVDLLDRQHRGGRVVGVADDDHARRGGHLAAIASRSCSSAAFSGTWIARAPVIAARCGYIENDGHA